MSAYRKRFSENIVIIVLVGIIGSFYLSVFTLDKIADSKINKMLEGENPSAELILALDSKNPIMRENVEEVLNEVGDPLLVALAPVCEGEAIIAKSYDPDSNGPHTLVFSIGKFSQNWTYEFLEDYGPLSRNPEDVELMVCVSEQTKTLETCSYKSGSRRRRIQHSKTLNIYEAATGELIESIYLEGSEPRGCPPFLILSSDGYIHGSRIKEKEVREILEGYYQ